jgi:hypothetical protein
MKQITEKRQECNLRTYLASVDCEKVLDLVNREKLGNFTEEGIPTTFD